MLKYLTKRMMVSLLFLSVSLSCLADFMYCPKPDGIVGYESELEIGKSLFPDYVNREDQVKLYITHKISPSDGVTDSLYVHSNFRPEGAESGIKIATGDELSLTELLFQIFRDPNKTDAELISLLRNNVTVILEPAIFKSKWEAVLDTTVVNDIKVLTTFGVRDVLYVKGSKGKSVKLISADETVPNIFARVEDLEAIDKIRSNGDRQLRKENLRLLSLTENTDVNRDIDASLGGRRVQFDFKDENSLRQSFKNSKGNIVICVGHVENGKFVSRKRTGAFTIDITRLEEIAKEEGIAPIIVGCGVVDSTTGIATVKETLHSSEILPQLFKAMNARTVSEFYDCLGAGGTGLVVSSEFTLGDRIVADIVRVKGGEGNGGTSGSTGSGGDAGENRRPTVGRAITGIGTYIEVTPLVIALALIEEEDEKKNNSSVRDIASPDGPSANQTSSVAKQPLPIWLMIVVGCTGGAILILISRKLWK